MKFETVAGTGHWAVRSNNGKAQHLYRLVHVYAQDGGDGMYLWDKYIALCGDSARHQPFERTGRPKCKRCALLLEREGNA